ncbi:hypothetical protein K501DRAFT_320045 [Backusella circina FSU 941]|nr:hypothetical protein K501DRAFT_320045 [Backusella circina FSU 941]
MDQASQANVMTFIRDHLDEIKFKTLRLNEVEPTPEQKLFKMEQLLQTDPALFLSKWGSNLGQDTLKLFKPIQNNYEVDYLLDSLLYQEPMEQEQDSNESSDNRRGPRKPKSALDTVIKNRRYAYLKQYLRHSDYFSEESMQLREPILYDQFIGQHIPMREREQPFSNTTGLVDRILSNIDNKYVSDHLERQKIIDEEQFEEEEEESDDDADEQERSTPALLSKSQPKDIKMKDAESQEEEDEENNMAELSEFREEQRLELIQLLEEKFLAGKDDTFDYVLVDYNDEYDDLEQQEQDIQDKYFDED